MLWRSLHGESDVPESLLNAGFHSASHMRQPLCGDASDAAAWKTDVYVVCSVSDWRH